MLLLCTYTPFEDHGIQLPGCLPFHFPPAVGTDVVIAVDDTRAFHFRVARIILRFDEYTVMSSAVGEPAKPPKVETPEVELVHVRTTPIVQLGPARA